MAASTGEFILAEFSSSRILPKHFHIEVAEGWIDRDEPHVLDDRLCGKHAVEGVAMSAGHGAGEMGVSQIDRQRQKP